MANVTASKLRDALEKHVDAGSILMTDESNAYARGGKRFSAHKTVDHSREEYAYRERKTGLLVTATAPSPISPCSSAAFTGRSTTSAKLASTAISRSSISRLTRGNCQTESVAAALLTATKGRRLVYENPDNAAHA